MNTDRQLYWIRFSNGETVLNITGEDFAKPENQNAKGRIILTWGTMRGLADEC